MEQISGVCLAVELANGGLVWVVMNGGKIVAASVPAVSLIELVTKSVANIKPNQVDWSQMQPVR